MRKNSYKCHLFVCVNDRKGERPSCADGDSALIRLRLKEEAKKRWSSGEVRVSQSLCMGVCDDGPNVVIYPQDIWFSRVTLDSVGAIIDRVGELLG